MYEHFTKRHQMDKKIAASRAQEARGAKQHDGRVQPGSGSGPYNRGDVKSEHYLIEYKRTDKKSITIKQGDLALHRLRALNTGRTPFFGIEVGGVDYLLVQSSDIDELIERRAGDLIRARGGDTAGLGNARPAKPTVQPAPKMRGGGNSRERSVLPRAEEVAEDLDRRTDDTAADGTGCEGVLLGDRAGRSRVPRPQRMPRLGDGELAAIRSVGRTQRAGKGKAERPTRGRT